MSLSIREIVEEHILSIRDEREPDGKWHPSSLFLCDRRAIYEHRGTPPSDPPSPRAFGIFRQGHNIHEFVQMALLDHSILDTVLTEVPIETDTEDGHADALVRTEKNGRWTVVEVKSISANGLRYGSDLPKDEHKAQAATYALLLSRSEDYGPIEDIIIAYVNKDTLEVTEFAFTLDMEVVADWYDSHIAKLEAYEAAGTLPPRLPLVMKGKKDPHLEKSYQCGYCPYATRCWKEDPD